MMNLVNFATGVFWGIPPSSATEGWVQRAVGSALDTLPDGPSAGLVQEAFAGNTRAEMVHADLAVLRPKSCFVLPAIQSVDGSAAGQRAHRRSGKSPPKRRAITNPTVRESPGRLVLATRQGGNHAPNPRPSTPREDQRESEGESLRLWEPGGASYSKDTLV